MCAFILRPLLLLYKWIRTRALSSEYKTDRADFTDWISFLQSQGTIREKCPYSELFWSVFSPNARNYVKNVRIRSYSGPHSVRMQEITDQNYSEYGHFLRSSIF